MPDHQTPRLAEAKSSGESTEDAARRIVAEILDVDSHGFCQEALFFEDLGLDSLGVIELLIAFENAFELDIPDEDIVDIRTFKDAVDYVNKRLGGAS